MYTADRTMRSSHSPTIRSRYDYYYSSMSPASSATNFYDNQNQSLFGDPVPPSTDFLETLDNHLYGSLRRRSSVLPPSVNNDVFIDDFMAAQSSGHHLRIASGRQRTQDRSAPTDSTFRDDFHYDLKRRSSSSFSDEFRANLDTFRTDSDVLIPTAPKRLFPEEPINYRNFSIQSNDSHKLSGESQNSIISSDWIRPNAENWREFPRPASRNVMHIDHGSAMMAILPESMTSSSDDNKSTVYGNVKQIQVLPFRKSSKSATVSSGARPNTNDSSSEEYIRTASPPKQDATPAILTETINIGSEFRFQPSRPHKKTTSFTIINELSPNQSRQPSPTGGRISPFRGKGFRINSTMRSMRPVSCPESPRNTIDLDTTSSRDDSQIHRPSVHFNIIPPIPRKRTAVQVIPATTQDDDDDNNQQSILDISYQDRDMESFEMLSNDQMRSGNMSRRGSIRAIYPETPRVKPSPAPRRHLQRSATNLNQADESDIMLTAPLVNPRSYHKGLLRVVSNASISPSKIPRRKSSLSVPSVQAISSSTPTSRKNSLVGSADRLHMRRDSSASPKRKKSVDLGGSMIDLGVTSTSMTPSRSTSRISKPTTLSPIIGTPNKDCEQDLSSHCASGDATSKKCNTDSATKIPVRRSSINKINGKTGSRGHSRESSPPKQVKSPTKIPQKINQKAASTTPTTTATKTTRNAPNDPGKSGAARSNHTHITKEASSTKKEPPINREKSSVKKVPPATVKRESSTLKRQSSNFKRESSQQKLKRENSTIGAKQATTKSKRSEQSTLLKNQSDSSLAKRLEKKNSFKQKRRTSSESDGLNEMDTANISDKLIPLTKPNVVSMTATAIASQPVQITAAVTNQLQKTNSSGQIVNNDNINNNNSSDSNNNNISNSNNVNDNSSSNKNEVGATMSSKNAVISTPSPSTTADKSQETIKKNTSDATDETQKTIDENASDLKTMESESANAAAADNATDNISAGAMAQLQKKASTRTLGGKSGIVNASSTPIKSEMDQNAVDNEPISSAIETKVNVIDSVLNSSADGDQTMMMLRSQPVDIDERQSERAILMDPEVESESSNVNRNTAENMGQDNINGIGSHIDSSTGVKNQTSENGDAESDDQTTCCKLCKCCTPCYASALCLPCRRLKSLSSCCKRSGQKLVTEENKAHEAITTILNETETKSESCWKRMKCCNRNKNKQQQEQPTTPTKKKIMDEVTSIEQQTMQTAQSMATHAKDAIETERSKCSMCLSKVFCCRKTNKVQQISSTTTTASHDMDEEVGGNCCLCIPCRRKAAKEPMAWAETRQDSLMSSDNMPKKSCCARLCESLLCCKKKEIVESRRTSMNSKKQSIAPTLPPEDTRPKLDDSLVDHTSVMKAAIPVLPVCLAWFCLICNCLIPGFGTICSGIFCLCLGIPRFSQHDGVRARIGSFVVNTFVGVAQAFTLIFCLVGWGWSIWWGMIMLRAARKHRKLLQTDETDLEEAQTIASHSTSNPPVLTQNHRDVEAGRTI